jgi:uncharacterized membrane protein
MARSEDSPPFVHLSVPNRSLGPRERRWCLAAIAATTFAVACAAAALGAWPVMPFAGIEIALVALAFHVVTCHDRDFERLVIEGAEVRVEARDAQREMRFVANRAWARVVLHERGARCALSLRYAGKTVPLGRMLSDEGRRRLAREIGGRLDVAKN